MKRACPRRLLEDVAAVCAHEKADRHEGQSDWRRRAYEETVLSRGVQRRVPSSLAVVDLALAGGEGDEVRGVGWLGGSLVCCAVVLCVRHCAFVKLTKITTLR